MKSRLILVIFIFLLGLNGYFLFRLKRPFIEITDKVLAAKFEELSTKGNSSCSLDFKNSISSMPDGGRLQGSCCSPMSLHRYKVQVAGLKKYKDIPEIPPPILTILK